MNISKWAEYIYIRWILRWHCLSAGCLHDVCRPNHHHQWALSFKIGTNSYQYVENDSRVKFELLRQLVSCYHVDYNRSNASERSILLPLRVYNSSPLTCRYAGLGNNWSLAEYPYIVGLISINYDFRPNEIFEVENSSLIIIPNAVLSCDITNDFTITAFFGHTYRNNEEIIISTSHS